MAKPRVPAYLPHDSCILKIRLLNPDKRPVAGIRVHAVSVKHALHITAITGRNGEAGFVVPLGGLYAIDLDEVKNFSFTNPVERPGISTIELAYEPTLISEINRNDTITQTITAKTRATSARSLFEMIVSDPGGALLAGENVFLHEVGSNRVFKAVTDAEGKAAFLI
ncbi:MAG TPA: hypothetical protein ENN08_02935, partial [Bacteroidales bacterium]|nr:hypothetical protein [Bacteroidales bacterium]